MVDPFEPRNWVAPAQAVATVSVPVVAETARPPVPAGPPPLPFVFTGRLTDGAEQVVYVSQGERVHVIRKDDSVGDQYKVIRIEPGFVEFLHLPTGEKQQLNIPSAES
jgi:hypothetical protein